MRGRRKPITAQSSAAASNAERPRGQFLPQPVGAAASLGSSPMKTNISVAPSNLERIRKTLRRLEIPESKLKSGLWRILNQSKNFASGAWIGTHVYDSRQTAERIANIYLREDGCRVELAFRLKNRTVREYFYPRWVARMLRDGRAMEYCVGKWPEQSGWRFIDTLEAAA